MAVIRGFRGVRYGRTDLDDLICPPYDVIDRDYQDRLYGRSGHNAVRVELARYGAADTPGDNRYTRARDAFYGWLERGVLRQEATPALYYCEEDYVGEFGETTTRKGFFAAVRLENAGSGVYHPHERTLEGPKADRGRLMDACRANLSPVFSLYDDPNDEVIAALETAASPLAPSARAITDDGVAVRVWAVTEPEAIRQAVRGMAGRPFFIADGHHRYETALAYRDRQRSSVTISTGDEPRNFVMMYLANMRSPGLTVFPTHRAVFGVVEFSESGLLDSLGEWFDVEVCGDLEVLTARMRAARGTPAHVYGLVVAGSDPLRLLSLRSEVDLDRALPEISPALRPLDVTILHSLVLERALGIDRQAQADQRNLRYVKGREALLEVVRTDPAIQCGLLLNPTRVDNVKASGLAGERMPQKSTFFYPKISTGLVFHLLDER